MSLIFEISISVPPPVDDRCTDPGTPQFAQRRISDQTFRINTRIDFTCQTGYRGQGRMSITCTSNRQWDSPIPQCIREGEPSQCVYVLLIVIQINHD